MHTKQKQKSFILTDRATYREGRSCCLSLSTTCKIFGLGSYHLCQMSSLYLCNAEIKHFNRLKIVTWLVALIHAIVQVNLRQFKQARPLEQMSSFFIKPQSQLNGFNWGHQCSWTLTPANSMQVSNMQSDDCSHMFVQRIKCFLKW